jgi:hypothetical protein
VRHLKNAIILYSSEMASLFRPKKKMYFLFPLYALSHFTLFNCIIMSVFGRKKFYKQLLAVSVRTSWDLQPSMKFTYDYAYTITIVNNALIGGQNRGSSWTGRGPSPILN